MGQLRGCRSVLSMGIHRLILVARSEGCLRRPFKAPELRESLLAQRSRVRSKKVRKADMDGYPFSGRADPRMLPPGEREFSRASGNPREACPHRRRRRLGRNP
ncbi:hypothetical protein FAIPA1_100131 [Frankia sp. AiPs1]